MTPDQFHSTYRSTADKVTAGTGIDPIALLAQWANETSWSTSWAGAPFNLGNIEASGQVIHYASLDAFAQACIATFLNGFYNAVLNATNAIDQLNAIVASPWSAGHYGGSLMAFYTPLEGFELTPEEHTWLHETVVYLQRISTAMGIVPGGPDPDQVTQATSTLLLQIDKDVKAQPTGGLTATQAQQLQEAHDRVVKDLA